MFKNRKSKALAAIALATLTGAANAALPVAATDAITAIQTDGTSMVEAGWPVVVSIAGGLVLIKLFKKVLGKVT